MKPAGNATSNTSFAGVYKQEPVNATTEEEATLLSVAPEVVGAEVVPEEEDDVSDEAVDRALLEAALSDARRERDAAVEAALKSEALVAELTATAEKATTEARELWIRVNDSDAEVENFRRNYALKDAQVDDAIVTAQRDAEHFVRFPLFCLTFFPGRSRGEGCQGRRRDDGSKPSPPDDVETPPAIPLRHPRRLRRRRRPQFRPGL